MNNRNLRQWHHKKVYCLDKVSDRYDNRGMLSATYLPYVLHPDLFGILEMVVRSWGRCHCRRFLIMIKWNDEAMRKAKRAFRSQHEPTICGHEATKLTLFYLGRDGALAECQITEDGGTVWLPWKGLFDIMTYFKASGKKLE